MHSLGYIYSETPSLGIKEVGKENGFTYFLDHDNKWVIYSEYFGYLSFQTENGAEYTFEKLHKGGVEYSQKGISGYIIREIKGKFYLYQQFLSNLGDLERIPNTLGKEKYFSSLDQAKRGISIWQEKVKILQTLKKIH